MKKIIFFGLLILVGAIFAGGAEAAPPYQTTGNPGDTAAWTVITAEGTSLEANYTDVNGNSKPPVYGETIEITVLPVYGFSMALLNDFNMYTGQIVTNETGITNEGNASDSIKITWEATVYGTGWTINYMRDGTLLYTTTESGSYTTNETLSEDTHRIYWQQVTAPDTTGTPGAFVVVTMEASTANEPTGQYTGANGLTYGGEGATSETATYTLYMPLMTLTRTATVDSPNIYKGLPTATPHDPVPGAVITYTLSYSNAGNTSAAGAIIVDKVPTSEAGLFATNLAHFNADTADRTNVTIEAGQGTATGWTVSWSKMDNPSKVYGNTADWSGGNGEQLGVINGNQFPASELYTYTSPEYQAKWVKWEKTPVASGESGTLTYGVTIR